MHVQDRTRLSNQTNGTSLTVMALFKNEADILWEWASHYLHQGAKQLILINNNSSDDWRGALGPLGMDPRLVCLNDPRTHSQERIYNDVRRSGLIESTWLLTCDLDEFVYARPPYETICDYLKQLAADITSVVIPWKLFGSSGHNRHPDGRTIDNFLLREEAEGSILIKTISRTAALEHLWVHHSRMRWGRCIRSDGTPGEQQPAGWLASTESQLSQDALHLNHYAVRSREFFERVKAKRGDVYSKQNETDRKASAGYFEQFDNNEIPDPELSQLSSCWAPQPPVISWFSPERPALPAGQRAPLFQLLHTAACLHPKRKQVETDIQGQWAAPAPEPLGWNLGIQGGSLPSSHEEITDLLPGIASVLSLPLDRRLPLVFSNERRKRLGRKTIRQWLALLKNKHPLVWAEQVTPNRGLMTLSHNRACDSWRALAQLLYANSTLRHAVDDRRPPKPIVLVLCRGRRPQDRRLNDLLKQASEQLHLPRVKLWKLPPVEQLKLFGSYRWVVGPYQPALALVHALGAMPGQPARVVLVCPSRQSKAVLASMELVEAIPHRLLLLPQAGEQRLDALLEALQWMGLGCSNAA